MDFIDQIRLLSDKVIKLKDQIQTEQATKNAFVMPFIQTLGYDIFDPTEVLPEFISDIGIKKGEKVDYAILKNGKPIIIIECKCCHENLTLHNSQLFRYFHVSEAKFAILTNGIIYQFFTDLEEPNKMDSKPFLEFDIINIPESLVSELKKFQKISFDVNEIFNCASELKYCKAIKSILTEEMNKPSEEFTRFFVKQICSGKIITSKVIEQFSPIIKKSISQLISETISDRFKIALASENEAQPSEISFDPNKIIASTQAEALSSDDNSDRIVTIEEEMDGFYIIKSIIAIKSPDHRSRIFFRDTINYFGILLDDNARKPICRLWLNRSKKYLGLFDEAKKEIRYAIESLDDIYSYADKIVEIVERYEQAPPAKEEALPMEEPLLVS